MAGAGGKAPGSELRPAADLISLGDFVEEAAPHAVPSRPHQDRRARLRPGPFLAGPAMDGVTRLQLEHLRQGLRQFPRRWLIMIEIHSAEAVHDLQAEDIAGRRVSITAPQGC